MAHVFLRGVSPTALAATRTARDIIAMRETHRTALLNNKRARDLKAQGWLREVTGFERNRLYRYPPYLDLFHRETLECAFAQA